MQFFKKTMNMFCSLSDLSVGHFCFELNFSSPFEIDTRVEIDAPYFSKIAGNFAETAVNRPRTADTPLS